MKLIKEITAEKLQEFVSKVFDTTKIHSLIHGNLRKEDAIEYTKNLQTYLNSKPLKELHYGKSIMLPDGRF